MNLTMVWKYLRLSVLDEAMLSHMKEIVYTEHRPFSYKDFVSFDDDGKKYSMTHGTFRNKICKFQKEKIVELEYNSKICFYTLVGIHFTFSTCCFSLT